LKLFGNNKLFWKKEVLYLVLLISFPFMKA
jgi:hypothetical protein